MAGSAVEIQDSDVAQGGLIKTLTFNWTSDDTTGSVSSSATFNINGLVYGIETVPIDPSDQYDVTLTDSSGRDILGGAGANRSDANTEYASALDDGGNVVPIPVSGPVTLNVTNAGNSKTGTVIIYYMG